MLLDIGRAGALCKSRRNEAVLYNTVVSYESIILLLKYCLHSDVTCCEVWRGRPSRMMTQQ